VFLWASLEAERLSVEYDAEPVYVGATFADVGLLEGTAARTSGSRSTVRTPPVPSSSATACLRSRS
jgi:hypothetical protein